MALFSPPFPSLPIINTFWQLFLEESGKTKTFAICCISLFIDWDLSRAKCICSIQLKATNKKAREECLDKGPRLFLRQQLATLWPWPLRRRHIPFDALRKKGRRHLIKSSWKILLPHHSGVVIKFALGNSSSGGEIGNATSAHIKLQIPSLDIAIFVAPLSHTTLPWQISLTLQRLAPRLLPKLALPAYETRAFFKTNRFLSTRSSLPKRAFLSA